MATDLRASMGLFWRSRRREQHRMSRVYHLDRGYEALDEKLRALGATRRAGARRAGGVMI